MIKHETGLCIEIITKIYFICTGSVFNTIYLISKQTYAKYDLENYRFY